MRTIVFGLICIILMAGFTACTTANPPPQTVTVTSTATTTATATTTTTATVTATMTTTATTTATATVTATPTPSLSPTPSPTPVVNFDKYNNSSFFLSSYMSATKTTVDPNGSVVSTPVYTDIFGDLPLGGFVTDKEAIKVPKIPSVTSYADWIYKFNFPVYDFPFVLNMGYMLKPDSPNAKVDFYVLTKEVFNSTYEKTPLNIYTVDLAKNSIGISNEGIYSYKINATGDLVAVFRTANASDIEGWWFKYGGKHY